MNASCQDVIAWFGTLSGAKRIELMCGLMGKCIPLEVRFFETAIKNFAIKECNVFRDAELHANSRKELEKNCKYDLLEGKNNIEYMGENQLNGNDGEEKCIRNETGQLIVSKYSPRPQLIISICLLQPTNRVCASILYEYLQRELNPQKLFHVMYSSIIPKNYPPHRIEKIFEEVLLLLTLARHHPAFSYEEHDLLGKQKEEVEEVMRAVNITLHQNAVLQATAAIQHHQQQQSSTQTGPTVPNSISGSTAPNQATYPNANSNHPHNASHTQQQQQQQQQQHSAAPSQQVHYYGGPHPQHQQSSANLKSHSHAQQTPPTPSAHLSHIHTQPTFPISFIQTNPVPIANLTYPPTPSQVQPGAGGPVVQNSTNTVMPNMSILRISSPPSITSTSPSPTISPSTVKMAVPSPSIPNQQPPPITIKLPNDMYTGGLGPNSVLTFVNDTGGSGTNSAIPFIPQSHVILDDIPKSNLSNNASPVSCYNCGNMGHRGTECTTDGDDNR